MPRYQVGLPVPDDWTEAIDGYCEFCIQVPNSPKWRAVYRGALLERSVETFWDAGTGNVENTTTIADAVFVSLVEVC